MLIEDTVTWLKGSHSISLGGAWTQYTLWAQQLGAGAADRLRRHQRRSGAAACSRPPISPARRTTNVTAARRTSTRCSPDASAASTATRASNEATGEYEYMGTGIQRARMREGGLFLQDAWRLAPEPDRQRRPALRAAVPVLSAEQQLLDGDDGGRVRRVRRQAARRRCNLFQPGVQPRQAAEFVNFGEGTARL